MKRNSLRLFSVFISLLGCIQVSTSPAYTAEAVTPLLNKLIEGAKAERVLNMLGSGIDDPKAWSKWEKAMRAKYGIDIQLKFTRGPAMPQMASRLMQEFKAGKPPTTDLYIGSESHFMSLRQAGVLEGVNWAEISPAIPPGALATDGVGAAFVSRMPGVSYNTKLVPKDKIPRVLDDLLDPRWKGKIASTPYAAAFDRAAMLLGDERVTKFLNELARANLAGLLRCSEEERIVSGEFALFGLTCGGGESELLKTKGAPIDHVILEDLPIIGYWYLGVPKHSPHPNLAKLFTVFMLTEEAQKILWEAEGYDLHLLRGTNTYRLVEGLRRRGIELRVFGVQEVVGREKVAEALRKKYQEILRNK
ncbi:MAG: ABC transporter substrate-binding protein [Candidatus Binatia bacterium]